MIDDLFSDLAANAAERLLSPETPRDESDLGLARLNARLSRESESVLFASYFQLGPDDLQQLSPRVHEWLLERVSVSGSRANPETLRQLYFLFPETTVRHAVAGVIIDGLRPERTDESSKSAAAAILEDIANDRGLSDADRGEQLRLLADHFLDFADAFPAETAAALWRMYSGRTQESLASHLDDWATRIGGEFEARFRKGLL